MNDLSIRQIRANTSERAQTVDFTRDISAIPATGPARKPATSAVPLVNPGMRESIVAQVCVFGKTCGQVARQMGLERASIETVLVQELSKKCASEYRRGYEAGRRPNPPASTLRPALRRAA